MKITFNTWSWTGLWITKNKRYEDHYWGNWKKWNMVCRLDNCIVSFPASDQRIVFVCLFVCFLNEWASLVAQTGKIQPVMQETQVWPLGWEDPLERGIASYPLQYSWVENLMDRGLWSATVHAVAKSQTQLSDSHFHFFTFFNLKKKYQNIY